LSTPEPTTHPTLRPLRIGEILGTAIRLTLSNVRTLIPLVAIIVVPLAIIDAVLLLATLHNGFIVDNKLYLQTTGGYNGGRYAMLALRFLGSAIAAGLVFRAVSTIYLGGQPSVGESARAAFSRAGTLVMTALVVTIGTLIGLVLLVLPGIWFAVTCAVAVPAVMMEGRGAFEAIGRSQELVRGRWWATFGAFLVAYLLLAVVEFVLGLILGAALLGGHHSLTALGVELVVVFLVAQLITIPFIGSVITVIYFDLRVRKEGLDVEHHAREVGLLPGGAVATPPPTIATDAPGGLPTG